MQYNTLKRLRIILATVFFFPVAVSAQNQGNIWYFGISAGLDFNEEPPGILNDGQTYYPTCCGWNESTSSISDSLGELLFYSNGEKAWNRQHDVMPNGNGLDGHASSTHSSLIVPQPGSDRLFYLFTTDAWEDNFLKGMRYSVVDMCLEGGLGDVVESEKNVLLLESAAEKLAGVLHANQTDYWVIGHELNSDAFYAFLLTEQGFTDTVVSNTGTSDMQGWGGQMVVSPNGELIVYNVPNAQVIGISLLLDFDTETGVVSNERVLDIGGRDYGASFSPDNTKLYCSKTGVGSLYQYDVTAGSLQEIVNSKTFIFDNQADQWRDLCLGPNGKIYIARAMQPNISVIHNPNENATACNYVEDGIFLEEGISSFGLPVMITGYNYPKSDVRCEHTGINIQSNNHSLNIFPNPANDQINVQFTEYNLGTLKLTIYNAEGAEMAVHELKGTDEIINIRNLSKGLHFAVLSNDGMKVGSSRFVVGE